MWYFFTYYIQPAMVNGRVIVIVLSGIEPCMRLENLDQ